MLSSRPSAPNPPMTINPEDAGLRLDRFLRQHCPSILLSKLHALIRQGEVRINGKRADAASKVALYDAVRLPPLLRHQWQDERLRQTPVSDAKPLIKPLPDTAIIYEDEALVVVNKPEGLACHGGSGVSWGLIEYLREYMAAPKMELVHRLDRDTSGILLLSRSRQALRPLHAQFREGRIQKEYRAIVYGLWSGNKRHLRHPLYKFDNDNQVHKVIVSSQGKPAHTEVKALGQSTLTPPLSLLQLIPHTGRTHQLRVHLAHEGHAIVGDQRYADFSEDRAHRQTLGLKALSADRMFLHAYQLNFTHPLSGQPMRLQAPLPEAFIKLIQSRQIDESFRFAA